MVIAEGAAAKRLGQLPYHQRPDHQQRQRKPAAHQSQAKVEGLRNRFGRTHAATERGRAHRVARGHCTEGKATQQQYQKPKFRPTPRALFEKSDSNHQDIHKTRQKQRGILAAAHDDRQQHQQRVHRSPRGGMLGTVELSHTPMRSSATDHKSV